MLKIKQKCFNLASFKLEFLKIGLMNLRFLKACGSGRLWDTFQSQVCFTVHGNKIFMSKKVPKYTCLPSFIVEWLYLCFAYNPRLYDRRSKFTYKVFDMAIKKKLPNPKLGEKKVFIMFSNCHQSFSSSQDMAHILH